MTNQTQKLLKEVCIIFRVLDASVTGPSFCDGGFEFTTLASLSAGILPKITQVLATT